MTADRLAGLLKEPSSGPLAPEKMSRPDHGLPPAGDEGTYLRPVRRDLSERLPTDVALLKVIPAGAGFRLEGYFRGQFWNGGDPDPDRHLRPDQSVSEVLDTDHEEDLQEAAVGYYETIMAWSSTKYELHRWLSDLRRHLGEGLRLVVWDDTDLGLPWELYRFAVDGDHAWLGAAMQVTRWTTVHDADRHDQFSAAKDPRPSGAEIICFEDSSLVPPDTNLTITTLSLCKKMESLAKLCGELDSDTAKYGLVYVRTHGRHGGSLKTARLGNVTLAQFETLRMRAIRASGSVVLLNACNSARPVFDPAPGDRVNRNFAEIFLRHHARAVLATLGEVRTGPSAALARTIVGKARDSGVSLPELLRSRRADAAERLPPNTLDLTGDDKKAILDFLRASLYVYFGHPDFSFRLGGQ